MKVYIYTRFSPRNEQFASQLEALEQRFPHAIAVQDRVKGRVPALERPAFVQMFNQLQSGDTLALWWLNALAPDFKQSVDIISQLFSKGVTIQTVNETLTFSPQSSESAVLLALLKGYADADKHHRLFAAEMGRRALKENPRAWKEKFRGRPADREKHQHIAALLLEGKTLQQVADETDSSLSTVKRVKSRISDHDESGLMRRRERGERLGKRGHHGKPHARGARGEPVHHHQNQQDEA